MVSYLMFGPRKSRYLVLEMANVFVLTGTRLSWEIQHFQTQTLYRPYRHRRSFGAYCRLERSMQTLTG
jgi:hypothetical protein